MKKLLLYGCLLLGTPSIQATVYDNTKKRITAEQFNAWQSALVSARNDHKESILIPGLMNGALSALALWTIGKGYADGTTVGETDDENLNFHEFETGHYGAYYLLFIVSFLLQVTNFLAASIIRDNNLKDADKQISPIISNLDKARASCPALMINQTYLYCFDEPTASILHNQVESYQHAVNNARDVNSSSGYIGGLAAFFCTALAGGILKILYMRAEDFASGLEHYDYGSRHDSFSYKENNRAAVWLATGLAFANFVAAAVAFGINVAHDFDSMQKTSEIQGALDAGVKPCPVP